MCMRVYGQAAAGGSVEFLMVPVEVLQVTAGLLSLSSPCVTGGRRSVHPTDRGWFLGRLGSYEMVFLVPVVARLDSYQFHAIQFDG